MSRHSIIPNPLKTRKKTDWDLLYKKIPKDDEERDSVVERLSYVSQTPNVRDNIAVETSPSQRFTSDVFNEAPYSRTPTSVEKTRKEPFDIRTLSIEPAEKDAQELRLQTSEPKTAQTTDAIYQHQPSYFDPIPDKVRPRDFIREIPGAAQKVTVSFANWLHKDFFQHIMRTARSVGVAGIESADWHLNPDLPSYFTGKYREPIQLYETDEDGNLIANLESFLSSQKKSRDITTRTEVPQIDWDSWEDKTAFQRWWRDINRKINNFMFGDDDREGEPPDSLHSIGAEIGEAFGMKPETADRLGGTIGFAMFATDWVPVPLGAQGKKKFAPFIIRLAKQMDESKILKALRRLDVSEDIAKNYYKLIAKETDPDKVARMVARIFELQDLTTPGKTKLVERIAGRITGVSTYGVEKTPRYTVTKNHWKRIRESTLVTKELDAYIKGISAGMARGTKEGLDRGTLTGFSSGFTKGLKDGSRITKSTISDVQTNLIDFLKKSGLEDLNPFIKTIKNIQTPKDLERMLPRLTERINTILNRNTVKKLQDEIFSTLNSAKTRIKGGIERGTLGPEAHSRLDDIFAAVSKKQSEADRELAEIITRLASKDEKTKLTLTPELAREIDLLQMAGVRGEKVAGKVRPTTKPAKELEDILAHIDYIIREGGTRTELQRLNYESYMDRLTYGGMKALTGDKGLKPAGFGVQEPLKGLKRMSNVLDNWLQGTDSLLDKLSKYDKTNTGRYDGFLNRMFGDKIKLARNNQTRGTRAIYDELSENFAKHFNVNPKNRRKLRSLVNENKRETVPLTLGNETKYFSPNQIYKKWMEMQDPTLKRTFREGMGWTDDTFRQINRYMDNNPKLKSWARWQLDEFYPKYGKTIAPVFESRFNAPFKLRAKYSPIERTGYEVIDWDKSILDKAYDMTISFPGSLKARADNLNPLVFKDGDEVLVKHILEMEHFKHFEDIIRDMRRFFGHTEIKTAIRQYHGEDILVTMNKLIDNIARDGMDMANSVVMLDRIRAGFVRSTLGVNPAIFFKQMMSTPAYITEMPGGAYRGIQQWAKYTAEFWSNPRKCTKILSESELMKARHSNISRDLRVMMKKQAEMKALANSDSWLDKSLVALRAGDRLAIYSGGWAVYKSNYDELIKRMPHEKAHKKALEIFERVTARTQQSGLIEDLSRIQTSGSFGKLFTVFMTAPQQYYRIASRSVRNLKYGIGDTATNTRNLIIAWGVLPMMFQYAADGFQFKKERQLRAFILGPLNGIPIIGDVVESYARATTGDDIFPRDLPGPLSALTDPVWPLARVANKIRKEDADVEWEDLWNMIESLATLASRLKGVPFRPALDRIRGTKDALEGGDFRRLIFSEYALGTDGKGEQFLKGVPYRPGQGVRDGSTFNFDFDRLDSGERRGSSFDFDFDSRTDSGRGGGSRFDFNF